MSKRDHIWNIKEYSGVDSTNNVLPSRSREGEKEGVVIYAHSQTKGSGRFGRTWH